MTNLSSPTKEPLSSSSSTESPKERPTPKLPKPEPSRRDTVTLPSTPATANPFADGDTISPASTSISYPYSSPSDSQFDPPVLFHGEHRRSQIIRTLGLAGSNFHFLIPSLNPLFPALSPPSARLVRALYDYTPETDEEFAFSEGDLIAVTETSRDGWWRGYPRDDDKKRQAGPKTLFPSNWTQGPVDITEGDLPRRLFYGQSLSSFRIQHCPTR